MTLSPEEIATDRKRVPFTNYQRPDGRREETAMPVAIELSDKVDQILAKGYKFESEYLSTGDWSFTITDPEEGDLSMEILFRHQMGGNAREAAIATIEKMIREFKL